MTRAVRTTALAVVVTGSLALATGGFQARAGATAHATSTVSCPTSIDAHAFTTTAQLRKSDQFLNRLGVRPTGSRAQKRYIAFIRRHVQSLRGVTLQHRTWTIPRFVEHSTRLVVRAGGHRKVLSVAAAVPYSHPTGRHGVTAPLVAIPDNKAITAANARGKIVVRPAPPGSVPYAVFEPGVLGWSLYDPHHTINPTASFYGDFINYNARLKDLHDAKSAHAKGILFTEQLPTSQLRKHYEPYEGQRFAVPAQWLGNGPTAYLDRVTGGGHKATARITLRAAFRQTKTSSLFATVPGVSKQRLVVDSHTDGTNVVEDDGPIAMIAMARYLTHLPRACRPRTVEFSFSTAHFYQRVASPTVRDGGAEQFAERLDAQYDKGTVGAVMVLEHLGSLDETMVARKHGPGDALRYDGLPTLDFIAITPSPDLVDSVNSVVTDYGLARTALLQGADLPGATVPTHCSFGGEGTSFNEHLLPTVGVIAAPQSLYDPAFGMRALDVPLMHREAIAFTDLLQRMGHMSQPMLAGSIPSERTMRAAGAPGCPASV